MTKRILQWLKKGEKDQIIKSTTTIIKLSLKYLLSEGNICIAEPNLEVLTLT